MELGTSFPVKSLFEGERTVLFSKKLDDIDQPLSAA